MKNKIKKIGLSLLLPSISIPLIVVTSLSLRPDSAFVNKNNDLVNSNDGTKYLFNGKYYDSLDDITNELANNNSYINSDLYYGNARDAIFDYTTNRLNVNELRKLDSSRVSAAYIDSRGELEQDFQKAKKSFVNPGLIVYKYQDTQGKLHPNISAAKKAIEDGVKVDEAVFYEITDMEGKKHKINPLNLDDINKLKEISFKSAKKVYNQGNTSSPFDIMPMIADSENNFNVLSTDATWLNNLFSQTIGGAHTSFYNELKDQFSDVLNKVLETTKFNSTVKFQYSNNDLKYNIKFDSTPPSSSKLEIKKDRYDSEKIDELIFKGIDYNHLNNFDVFLSREKWNKELEHEFKVDRITQQAGWVNFKIDQADKLQFNNFLNNPKFEIYSSGKDGTNGSGHDQISGINTQILQAGKWKKSQLHFDLTFSLANQTEFINQLKTKLIEEISSSLPSPNNDPSITQEKIFRNEFIGTFLNDFKTIVLNGENSVFNTKYSKYGNDSIQKNINNLSVIENKMRDLIVGDVDGNDFKEENFEASKNLFLKQFKALNYYISYNNIPVFSIDYELKLEDKNLDRKTTFFFLYLSLFDEKDIKNKFKNISNLVSSDGKKISSNSFMNTKINEEGYFEIPNDIKEYQGKLNINAQSGNRPTYSDNLYYALNSYNRNLKELKAKYSNFFPKEIEDKMIKSSSEENNILVLRNVSHSSSHPSILDVHYGEFISLAYDLNESLANEEKQILYDKVTLSTTIRANNIIEPAQVIVVYDLSGNIINPGIVLSEDLVAQTTSDAMFDSEGTILDNIYRTLIIKKDPNKFFYKNENNTYTLLDYETNFIYDLNYDGKSHYFLNYHDAWLYLREIIALEAQKVNIKGVKNEGK